MEESSIRVPLFYVLGRDATAETVRMAHEALSITPCCSAIVSRPKDKELIQAFVEEVLQANDESACKELAAHVARSTNSPSITVGEGKTLIAVYPDGGEEEVCLSKPIYTN